ncbi:hypothetical protein QWJ34_16175 [Saccharibacillus sp. CPCC 101409]|uniref:hypothetical protein n=1 Tax=Saccharibacillus sp. CPCC 101409 TaxID=3058041 RepID=UPI002671694C|nr:hypothetical protein [Saccharibacillus sp. CPCC 101409]MDO3411303.1 hypothetical protein [Saccharibacillus sp. CPCC 101409]
MNAARSRANKKISAIAAMALMTVLTGSAARAERGMPAAGRGEAENERTSQ